MAPRKCVENDKKPPRKRVVKPKLPKPVLKTPSVINVIQNESAECHGVPMKLSNKLTTQRKLDLANEVALGQLCKQVREKSPTKEPINTKIQIMGRGKRKPIPTTKISVKKIKNLTPVPVNNNFEIENNKPDNNILPKSDTEEENVALPVTDTPPPKRGRKKLIPHSPIVKNNIQTTITGRKQSNQGKKRGRPLKNQETLSESPAIEEGLLVAKKEKSPDAEESPVPKKAKSVATTQKPKKSLSLKKNNSVKRQSSEKSSFSQSPMTTRSSRKNLACENNRVSGNTEKEMNLSPLSGQVPKNNTLLRAEPIACRKISVASNNSCLSWTQDISTSSSTTCITVNSKDFVRFDKKLPIIQMVNIEDVHPNLVTKTELESVADVKEAIESSSSYSSYSSDSDSSSSDSSSSKCEQNLPETIHSPPLSTSSLSNREYRIDLLESDMMKLNAALDKLAIEMKTYDMRMVEWINSEPRSAPNTGFVDRYLKVFKHENDVILDCRKLDMWLSSRDTPPPGAVTPPPRPVTPPYRPGESLHVSPPRIHLTSPPKSATPPRLTFTSPRRPVASPPKPVDSSPRTVYSPPRPVTPPPRSVASPPRPVTPPPVSYDNHFADRTLYTSFEHDDDDALSLFAESITGMETSRLSTATATPAPTPVQEYIPAPVADIFEKYEYKPTDISRLQSPVCEKQTADSTSRSAPFLIPQPPAPATILFRECCFHHLVSQCPFKHCLYPHKAPTEVEIARTVSALEETTLRRELALIRRYPALRRYEAALVAELKRREPANHTTALETTLQHLNGATDYAAVLRRTLGNRWLCDAMLQALSDTQNFSRFKVAFVKLARFAAENERAVSVAVATKILERVCILPAEMDLAIAMTEILKLTSPTIYQSDMMSRFESKLAALDKCLYEQHLGAKARLGAKSLASPLEREKRYTSPDTTHFDNMNNPEPGLTRTVDFKNSLTSTSIVKSISQPSYQESSWRGMFHPPRSRRPMRRPMMQRSMMRPNFTRPYLRPNQPTRQVTYRYSPNKYVRRPHHGF